MPHFQRIVFSCILLIVNACAHQVASQIEYTQRMYQLYYVKPGDTVKSVAKKYDMTIKDLRYINQLQPDVNLAVGQRLHVHKRKFEEMTSEVTQDPPPSTRYLNSSNRHQFNIIDFEDFPGPKENDIPRTTHTVIKRKGLGKLLLPVVALGGSIAALRPKIAFALGSKTPSSTGSSLGRTRVSGDTSGWGTTSGRINSSGQFEPCDYSAQADTSYNASAQGGIRPPNGSAHAQASGSDSDGVSLPAFAGGAAAAGIAASMMANASANRPGARYRTLARANTNYTATASKSRPGGRTHIRADTAYNGQASSNPNQKFNKKVQLERTDSTSASGRLGGDKKKVRASISTQQTGFASSAKTGTGLHSTSATGQTSQTANLMEDLSVFSANASASGTAPIVSRQAFLKQSAPFIIGAALTGGALGAGAALVSTTIRKGVAGTAMMANQRKLNSLGCDLRPCFVWPINNAKRAAKNDPDVKGGILILNTNRERYVRPANHGIIEKIIEPKNTGNKGLYTIVIDHSYGNCKSTFKSVYSGLVKVSDAIKVGMFVERDIIIGEANNCCDSSISFRILDNDMPVKNTRRYLPSSE